MNKHRYQTLVTVYGVDCKTCSKCKVLMETYKFSKDSTKPTKLRSDCKECGKSYRDNRKEKLLLETVYTPTLLDKVKTWLGIK